MTDEGTQVAAQEVEKIDADRVIRRSLTTWIRNFLPVMVLSAIPQAYQVYTSVAFVAAGGTIPKGPGVFGWLDDIEPFDPLDFLCTTLGELAVIYFIVRRLPGTSAALRTPVARLLHHVEALIVALAVGILAEMADQAFFLLGFVVTCMLAVAVPVAIVERRGVVGSLVRSVEVTMGQKAAIFGAFVFLRCLGLLAFLGTMFAVSNLETGRFPGVERAAVLCVMVWPVLVTGLEAVTSVVVYEEIRGVRPPEP